MNNPSSVVVGAGRWNTGTRFILAVVSFAILSAGTAFAHGGHGGLHMPIGTTTFGEPGGARSPSRVLDVAIDEGNCRIPGDVTARQGDVLAFVVRNAARRTSELVIGQLGAVAEHARQYAGNPDGAHDRHAMLHVASSVTGILVWRFTRVGIFEYGCVLHGPRPRTVLARVRVHR